MVGDAQVVGRGDARAQRIDPRIDGTDALRQRDQRAVRDARARTVELHAREAAERREHARPGGEGRIEPPGLVEHERRDGEARRPERDLVAHRCADAARELARDRDVRVVEQ